MEKVTCKPLNINDDVRGTQRRNVPHGVLTVGRSSDARVSQHTGHSMTAAGGRKVRWLRATALGEGRTRVGDGGVSAGCPWHFNINIWTARRYCRDGSACISDRISFSSVDATGSTPSSHCYSAQFHLGTQLVCASRPHIVQISRVAANSCHPGRGEGNGKRQERVLRPFGVRAMAIDARPSVCFGHLDLSPRHSPPAALILTPVDWQLNHAFPAFAHEIRARVTSHHADPHGSLVL